MTIHVQFEDETEANICTVFCGPQDPEVWANLGEVEQDDPRYVEFMAGFAFPL